MNRRNFFGALGAAGAVVVLGHSEPEIRYVQFSPPREEPNIYYVRGHNMPLFGAFSLDMKLPIQPSQVKQGYASFKLDRIGIYLSDTPQPNFEPITYWIREDYQQEVTP